MGDIIDYAYALIQTELLSNAFNMTCFFINDLIISFLFVLNILNQYI